MHFPRGKSWLPLFIAILYAIAHVRTVHAISIIPHHDIKKENEPTPWFTGPLLTPSGHVVPNGHYNIEPYEYVTTNYGLYDAQWQGHSTPKFYNLMTQISVQIGLPANFDFVFTPEWSWNHREEGASQWTINDLTFGFDYQLYDHKKGSWWPSTKLAIRADLPIGKYQKLNPRLLRTDIGGTGSWLPRIGIDFAHIFWWGGHVFFAPRLNFQYVIPTPVHVKGHNTYGGGHHTHGKVFPGQTFIALFGFEISLSQRWAIAGDINYVHLNKTRFKGHTGSTHGIPNKMGSPSSESWSLAPALEYNWNENYGIIAGVWFSVAGRHWPEFASGVIAVNIYK